jgi:hypothetical protein
MTKKASVKNKKHTTSCKAITTCTKSPKVYRQGDLRYVKINERKHYFVSDLVMKHGRGFVDLLEKSPMKLRIKDNNNSQERRLVSAAEAKALKLV